MFDAFMATTTVIAYMMLLGMVVIAGYYTVTPIAERIRRRQRIKRIRAECLSGRDKMIVNGPRETDTISSHDTPSSKKEA